METTTFIQNGDCCTEDWVLLFETVVVNEGYQGRDFQASPGGAAASVIDPEILGKLRKEATTLRNRILRYQLAVYAGLYIGFMLLFVGYWSLGLVSDDVLFFGLVVFQSIWLVVLAVFTCRRKNVDIQLTSLVESYQPLFREDYGVELGYGRFSLSPKGGWVTLPGIYLRRPRRSNLDEQEASVGEADDNAVGTFSPIYLVPLIPGEIHIDETKYDAASMKVDAETWALLQSTHQVMVQWHPMMKFLAILCLLGFFVLCNWLGIHAPCGGFIPLILGAVAFIVAKICEHGVDARNLKVYEKVTKVVNEVLQQQQQQQEDGRNAQVAVEFHDSELPGREGKLSRRYQFVHTPLATAPTMNEPM